MIKRWTSTTTRVFIALAVIAALVAIGAPPAGADADDVVINELHYHPATDPDDTNDIDDLEFLELYNRGTTAVDLTGWSISDAITVTFGPVSIPAGGYVIISPSTAAAVAEYGVTPVAEYTGKLGNGGETVTLLDAGLSVIDTVAYDDAGSWPTEPDGDGPSLELRDPDADNTLPANWAASDPGPTPAALNTAVPATGAISNIVVSPATPGTAVTISADITGAVAPALTYKVMFGADVVVAMTAGPGDTWSATVPGQSAGQLVRYRFDDGAIGEPPSGDTIVYRGYVVDDSAVNPTLPDFRWFIEPDDYDDLQTIYLLDDTFVPTVVAYDGVVYDGVEVRVRGGSFARINYPKKSYEFEFPAGHDFVAPDILPYPIDQFAMNSSWVDWPFGRMHASWNLFEDAGSPTVTQFPVHLEQNGDFFGMYVFSEKLDGEWRDGAGLEDGEFYKAASGGFLQDGKWEVKLPKDGPTTPIDNVGDVLRQPPSAAKTQYLYDTFDIPNVVNYMAVSGLIGHNDQRIQNFYIFNDKDHTGRWQIYPWDLDVTFGTDIDGCDDMDIADLRCVGNPLFDSIYEVDELEDMYWRRVRTLYDGPFAEFLIEDAHDAHIATLGPTAPLDNAKWDRFNPLNTATFKADVAERRAVFNNEPRVPSAQAAAPPIVINELLPSPAVGQAEFLELYNPGTTWVDLSDWTLDGTGLVIPGGTIIAPGGYVVFTDDVSLFDDTTALAETVVVQYSGGLKGGGEAITLSTPNDTVVDTVTYDDGPPWPAVAEGFSYELLDPALDNALAPSWGSSNSPGGTPGAANDPAPPCASNDDRDDALIIGFASATPLSITTTNNCATGETGETAQGTVNSVWFAFQATSTGTVTVSTCAPSTAFDTFLAVYAPAGQLLASNDNTTDPDGDRCGADSSQAQLTLAAAAGGDYIVQVDGAAAAEGVFTLTVQQHSCAGVAPTQVGSSGNDVWAALPPGAIVAALAGNDTIAATSGVNRLCGDHGDDIINGAADTDQVFGGGGNDDIRTFGGDDLIYAGAGDDAIRSGSGDDTVFAFDGADLVVAGSGTDVVSGGVGADNLNGGAGVDEVSGDSGDDALRGQGSNDTLDAGAGNDVLRGHAGNDAIDGGDGDDTLLGASGDDTLSGGSDDDTLWASAGADDLDGGAGNDFCDGGNDTDPDTAVNCETEARLP